jgi:glutamate synthase domain-containing protein 2
VFAEAGLTDRIVFIGAGKLGFPGQALLAFALGCDGVNVGREAMLAIGCIQAQRCHTDRCPTGVTTQSKRRQRGLDPTDKSVRCAGYITQLRREILRLSHACGVAHPGLITTEQLEILDDHFGSRLARDVFGYEPGWGRPSEADRAAIVELMA